MSFLFGGSKQKSTSTSTSGNKAYDAIAGATAPGIRSGQGATSLLDQMLGIKQSYVQPTNGLDFLGRSLAGNAYGVSGYSKGNTAYDPSSGSFGLPRQYNPDNPSDPSAFYGSGMNWAPPNEYSTATPAVSSESNPFQSWLDNSGYSFVRDQGGKAIESSFGGRGVANSGAAAKALTKFGQSTANTYLQQYLDNLFKQQQAGLGNQALLSGAGSYSNSTGTSSGSSENGAGQAIGTALSLIALSDRSAKEGIEKVGLLDNGLGVYEFTYKGDDTGTRWVGVMADEVAVIQPEALGPVTDGYATVDYGKIEGWGD